MNLGHAIKDGLNAYKTEKAIASLKNKFISAHIQENSVVYRINPVYNFSEAKMLDNLEEELQLQAEDIARKKYGVLNPDFMTDEEKQKMGKRIKEETRKFKATIIVNDEKAPYVFANGKLLYTGSYVDKIVDSVPIEDGDGTLNMLAASEKVIEDVEKTAGTEFCAPMKDTLNKLLSDYYEQETKNKDSAKKEKVEIKETKIGKFYVGFVETKTPFDTTLKMPEYLMREDKKGSKFYVISPNAMLNIKKAAVTALLSGCILMASFGFEKTTIQPFIHAQAAEQLMQYSSTCKDSEKLVNVADILYRQGNHEDAFEVYKQAVECGINDKALRNETLNKICDIYLKEGPGSIENRSAEILDFLYSNGCTDETTIAKASEGLKSTWDSQIVDGMSGTTYKFKHESNKYGENRISVIENIDEDGNKIMRVLNDDRCVCSINEKDGSVEFIGVPDISMDIAKEFNAPNVKTDFVELFPDEYPGVLFNIQMAEYSYDSKDNYDPTSAFVTYKIESWSPYYNVDLCRETGYNTTGVCTVKNLLSEKFANIDGVTNVIMHEEHNNSDYTTFKIKETDFANRLETDYNIVDTILWNIAHRKDAMVHYGRHDQSVYQIFPDDKAILIDTNYYNNLSQAERDEVVKKISLYSGRTFDKIIIVELTDENEPNDIKRYENLEEQIQTGRVGKIIEIDQNYGDDVKDIAEKYFNPQKSSLNRASTLYGADTIEIKNDGVMEISITHMYDFSNEGGIIQCHLEGEEMKFEGEDVECCTDTLRNTASDILDRNQDLKEVDYVIKIKVEGKDYSKRIKLDRETLKQYQKAHSQQASLFKESGNGFLEYDKGTKTVAYDETNKNFQKAYTENRSSENETIQEWLFKTFPDAENIVGKTENGLERYTKRNVMGQSIDNFLDGNDNERF